jgi:tetratricopeptide (TPR) repeat protein
MKEHNANLCLTFLEEEFVKNVSIRPMIVNVQKPNGIYKTYCFDFYHFTTVSARDYLERGLVYARANMHNAAIRHFSHAIKPDSSFGAAFSYRGISYLNRHKFDKAINDLTQAIEIDSEESVLYLTRGLAYKKAGDFDKAKADFTKALELNPDDKMAKEYLEEISNAEK